MNRPNRSRSTENPIATAEAVELSIGGRRVLDGVDLQLAPGTIVALLGENGAGKTSLMRTLCGRIAPLQGRVRVKGRDPRLSLRARRAIGYVPQSIALYPELTVRENLRAFGAYVRDACLRTRSDRGIMEVLDLASVAERRVGQLSGGYQRLVNLGASLAALPAFLALDEPTVGLDAAAKTILLDVVRREARRGAAVLLTTHDLDAAAAVADRVGVLQGGRIVAEGRLQELLDRTFGQRMAVTFRTATPVDAGLSERLSGCGLLPPDAAGSWRSSPRGVGQDVVTLLTGIAASDRTGLQELSISRPGLKDLYDVMTKHSVGP